MDRTELLKKAVADKVEEIREKSGIFYGLSYGRRGIIVL